MIKPPTNHLFPYNSSAYKHIKIEISEKQQQKSNMAARARVNVP